MKPKILVTGADGFIGSHLVETAVDAGYPVKAFVFYQSNGSWGWLESLPAEKLSSVEIYAGDIRDPSAVRQAVQGVDSIFHLAALIAIPFSYQAPDSYVDTNIRGTLNVLQACRDSEKISQIILTSTSEVYGTAQYTPIDEKHPFQAQSPYSATKIAADRLGEAFFRSFNLPVTIARPFNTFGPRQSARAVIPTIISQLLTGASEIKLGSLTPTRDLTYVKDTCLGLLSLLGSKNTIGEEINIASGTEISIKDLAEQIISIINPAARVILDPERVRPEKSEVERLVGCNKKIKSLTGWQPSYSFADGLRETIEWLKVNHSQYKSELYNV